MPGNIHQAKFEGLDTAARSGKHGGRPPVITDGVLHTGSAGECTTSPSRKALSTSLRHGTALLERAHANPPVPAETRRAARPNPKRAMRLAAKEAARIARGSRSTASQEALRRELEQRTSHSAEETRQRKQAESERKYAIARAKRKERKRGR
ncbi:DUF2992 family protein [Streptomyces asiaticus]|uniref:DUF2992 family protein n=1 Tax=Streptomyces asiaticus TaxID=114695 RepID=UPI003D7054C3